MDSRPSNIKKALLHAKRWVSSVNEKENIIKVGYLVEFFGHDGKKVFWEVVDDCFLEAPTDYGEIGLWRFDFNLFSKYNQV